MRDAATLLLALIDATEKAVTRPTADRVHAAELEVLRGELEGATAFQLDPVGGLLLDVEALLLAKVLCLIAKQRALGEDRRVALLQQLAGVLLPAVRQALSRALEVRRDTRPTP